MKSLKFVFALLLVALLNVTSYGQNTSEEKGEGVKLVETPASAEQPSYLNKSALALNVSTIGVGLEFAYNLNTHLNFRTRFNYLSVSDFSTEYDLNGTPVLAIANLKASNLDLLLEYLPFSKSSFKLVGGVSYFIDANSSVRVLYNESINYGEITLDPEEIGDLTVGLDYSGIAPYLGFGFGRAVPKRRVGFGVEIGTYYAGSPEVSLQSTEMLEPTAEAELEQLSENLSGYAWLPFVNLRLTVKL